MEHDPSIYFGTFLSPEDLVKSHYTTIYPQIEFDSPIFRNMNMVREHHNLTTGDDPFYYRKPDCRYYVVM